MIANLIRIKSYGYPPFIIPDLLVPAIEMVFKQLRLRIRLAQPAGNSTLLKIGFRHDVLKKKPRSPPRTKTLIDESINSPSMF